MTPGRMSNRDGPDGLAHADPHAGQTGIRLGPRAGEASAAVVLVHGRGGSPEGIADLARALDRPDLAWVAPRAAAGTWYPHSFLAPIEENQPWLDSALRSLGRTVENLLAEGIPERQIVFVGFSQGACLASEYVARCARRWGGLASLSGGLIGPAGTPRDYGGAFDGMPAFFGCGDPDPHIPRDRVLESGEVFGSLGATVETRLYPGLGHAVGPDELERVAKLLDGLT